MKLRVKQFVLDQGDRVLIALYTRRGKMIRIRRIARAHKLDFIPPPPPKPVS